jgi:hypothetical protein
MDTNPCGFCGQIVSGAIDGSNVTFTLNTLPSFLFLFCNGAFLVPNVGYTISGTKITLARAPEVGDVLYATICN